MRNGGDRVQKQSKVSAFDYSGIWWREEGARVSLQLSGTWN